MNVYTDNHPEAWRLDARCAEVSPEPWFPPKGDPAKDARAMCASCDVAAQCLQFALDNNEQYGIWGGTSPRQRAALRRGQAA